MVERALPGEVFKIKATDNWSNISSKIKKEDCNEELSLNEQDLVPVCLLS